MNDQKKGILPESELSDELLDGVVGGAAYYSLRPSRENAPHWEYQCACRSEYVYSKELADALKTKTCDVCGQKYTVTQVN